MEMLKLYWLTDSPLEEPALPEGYSFSGFDPEKDVGAWCDCLRNGRLIDGQTDEEAYRGSILGIPDIDPARDILFLDHGGEHVGTVTAFVYADSNTGWLHMVGIREDHRGKGLSKYLVTRAQKLLRERAPRFVGLVTSEERPAALKSYLAAGFLPVEYDYLMQARWRELLRRFGMESVPMLYEDGTPYKTLYRDRTEPKVRIGVLGAGRGMGLASYCAASDNAELVAVCDNDPRCLNEARERFGDGVGYYADFDEFLKHDMDLVVLANYANAHAPFAIKALDAGKNVLSELLPVQTMKEAVELVEAFERSGKRYFYGENCCFMPAPKKMTKLFRQGRMGEFQYGEGEYMHNLEDGWHHHSHSRPDHWRNTMSAFYYCTHSLGPIIHTAGLRPVSVSGFEAPFNKKMYRMGAKAGPFGMEVVTLENGAIVKSLHGVGPVKYSLWWACQGEKGILESAREIASDGAYGKLYIDVDSAEGAMDGKPREERVDDGLTELAENSGHGGADYYLLYNVCESLRGNKQADTIGLYEALDMFLPGMFAYFSVLAGNTPQRIPDLRNKEERDAWRNDTRCTDPAVAGDQLIPSYSKGNPEIPDSIYAGLRARLERDWAEEDAKKAAEKAKADSK